MTRRKRRDRGLFVLGVRRERAVLQSLAGGVLLLTARPPSPRLLLPAGAQPQLPAQDCREHVPRASTPRIGDVHFGCRGLTAAVTWGVSRMRLLTCRPELGHSSGLLEAMPGLPAQLPCLQRASPPSPWQRDFAASPPRVCLLLR